MNETIRALILGIIQGLTEFLPVSSSGHLELAKFFLGDTSLAHESLLMTITVHAATALATLLVFRREVIDIFRGLLKFQWNEETQYAAKIIISMIPAAVVGLLFEKEIEMLFNRQVLLVGFMLIITGLLLYLADRARTTGKPVSFSNAFIIGIAQAIAILPGISRSGATISSTVMLGVDRERAARFSFLMVVPLILGKMGKDILEGELNGPNVKVLPLIVGFAAAFITGWLACIWMIKLVKKAELRYFSWYCFIIAGIAIATYLYQD